VSADWEFPTTEEQEAGLAGGDGIGQNATGQLPIGFTDLSDWGSGVVWVGGPNVLFKGHADWGDRSPSDLNFTPQNVILTSTYAELVVAEAPDPDLTLNYVDPLEPPELLGLPAGKPFTIDLHKTMVVDSQNNDASAPLASFFKKVNQAKELVVDGDNAKFANSEQPDGTEFDFRFDGEGGKMGAGTAFLKGS
jgi:hypothetical protein